MSNWGSLQVKGVSSGSLSTLSTASCYDSTIGTISTLDVSNYYTTNLYSPTAVICNYMGESEIIDLINKIFPRIKNDPEKEQFLRELVRERHFSEQFLIDYWDFLSKDIVLRNHRADIQSGDYSRLALMLELK